MRLQGEKVPIVPSEIGAENLIYREFNFSSAASSLLHISPSVLCQLHYRARAHTQSHARTFTFFTIGSLRLALKERT